MVNFYDERIKLWQSLEKYGHKLNYKRPNDSRRYNLYLVNGLVRIECNHGCTITLTIDSTLHIWLEEGNSPNPRARNEKID